MIRGLGGPVVRLIAAHANGPGFDSQVAQHVQRLISRVFTLIHWSCDRQSGFTSFRCFFIQLCNNLGQSVQTDMFCSSCYVNLCQQQLQVVAYYNLFRIKQDNSYEYFI